MKNSRKISNPKVKAVLLAILFAAALFFTNDLGLLDVEKSAVIVAIGTDYEDNGYRVTCQMVRANSAGSSADQVTVSGAGKTVAESLNNVQTKTGWHPQLSFCRLLVLGQSVLEHNVNDCLDFFFRSEAFNDSALLAGCSGSAEDFLSQKTPLDDLSGFGLLNIIAKDNNRVNDVISISLLDYEQQYYSPSQGILLPFIETEELPAMANNEEPAQSGEKESVYHATSSAVVRGDRLAGVLSARMTRIFNLISRNGVKGYYSVPAGEDNSAAELVVLRKKNGIKVSAVNGQMRIWAELRLTVRIQDETGREKSAEALSAQYALSEKLRAQAELALQRDAEDLFAFMRENNCDLLRLGDKLRRMHPKQWDSLADRENYLANAEYLWNGAVKTT